MGCNDWSMILDVWFLWRSPVLKIDLSSFLMIGIWTYDFSDWLNLIWYLFGVPSDAWNHYSYDFDLSYFLDDFLIDFSYFLLIVFPYFGPYIFPSCMYELIFDVVWQVHETLWRGIRKVQMKELWKIWHKRLASLLKI